MNWDFQMEPKELKICYNQPALIDYDLITGNGKKEVTIPIIMDINSKDGLLLSKNATKFAITGVDVTVSSQTSACIPSDVFTCPGYVVGDHPIYVGMVAEKSAVKTSENDKEGEDTANTLNYSGKYLNGSSIGNITGSLSGDIYSSGVVKTEGEDTTVTLGTQIITIKRGDKIDADALESNLLQVGKVCVNIDERDFVLQQSTGSAGAIRERFFKDPKIVAVNGIKRDGEEEKTKKSVRPSKRSGNPDSGESEGENPDYQWTYPGIPVDANGRPCNQKNAGKPASLKLHYQFWVKTTIHVTYDPRVAIQRE